MALDHEHQANGSCLNALVPKEEQPELMFFVEDGWHTKHEAGGMTGNHSNFTLSADIH